MSYLGTYFPTLSLFLSQSALTIYAHLPSVHGLMFGINSRDQISRTEQKSNYMETCSA